MELNLNPEVVVVVAILVGVLVQLLVPGADPRRS